MTQTVGDPETSAEPELLAVGIEDLEFEGGVELEKVDFEEAGAILESDHSVKGIISEIDNEGNVYDLLDQHDLPSMVMTGESTEEKAIQALNHGADSYYRRDDVDEAEQVEKFWEEQVTGQEIDDNDGINVEEILSNPSDADFKSLIDNLGDSIFIVDEDQNLQYMNTVGREEINDLPIESVAMDLEDWENMGVVTSDMKRELENAYEEADQNRVGHATGRMNVPVWGEFPAHVTIVSLGEGYAGVVSDITELEEARKRIATLAKSVSHDVKNDFQVMKTNLELLDYSSISKENRERIEKVKDRLEGAEETARKTSKIYEIAESSEERVELKKYLDSVVEELGDEALERSMEINYELENPIYVCGGPMIDIMLDNIVENSIKHSEADNIDIYTGEEDETVVLNIEDDGVGMPEEIQEDMFENGGLGTQLIYQVAENYGIDVEVSSEDGTSYELKFEKM